MPGIATSFERARPGILGALQLFKENRRKQEEEDAMAAVREAARGIYEKSRPRVERRPDNRQDADALVNPPSVTAGAVTSPPLGERTQRTTGIVSRMEPAGMIPQSKIPTRDVTVPGEGAGFKDIMNLFTSAGTSESARGLAGQIAAAAERERQKGIGKYSVMNQEGGGYDIFGQRGDEPLQWLSGRAGVQKPVKQDYGLEDLQEKIRHNKASEEIYRGKGNDRNKKQDDKIRMANQRKVDVLTKRNYALGQENISYGKNINPKTNKPFVDAKKKEIAGYGTELLRKNVKEMNRNMSEIARLHGEAGLDFTPVFYNEETGMPVGDVVNTGSDDGGGEKEIVQTGTYNGRKVAKYSDGSVDFID